MKIFIYKTLTVFVSIFFLYHLTIGYQIAKLEVKIQNYFDKDKIIHIREKIKNEISAGVKKKRILSPEDAKTLNQFIQKISEEIKEAN
jgi:hypothetical protein